jgi:[NiFe] hydrogenase diaphorase moiety small subunit
MTPEITLIIDGREVTGHQGQTILEVADAAGIYIPRLCHEPSLQPFGGCRICTVLANGRAGTACTQPASLGMIVETDTEELRALRRDIVEMLLVEGNHFCMFCEKSGCCELQALAYRFGIEAPTFSHLWPAREVDASHPDILVDHNRCILCGRCVRASRELDGKNVFGFVNRGGHRRVAVNAETGLVGTDIEATDRAVDACPVGALLHKRVGHVVPIGRRTYDREPIGSDIEARRTGDEP